MTPVFISPFNWDEIDIRIKEFIEDLSSIGPVAIALPGSPPDNAIPGALTHRIEVDRPIELQPGARWITEYDDPVIVATHVSVEPVTISNRFPVAWVETSVAPRPIENALSLASRTGLVLAKAELQRFLGLADGVFSELGSADPAEIWAQLSSLTAHRPRVQLHGLLAAEMFSRTEIAADLWTKLHGVNDYTVARIGARLGFDERAEESLRRYVASGDANGAAAALVADPSMKIPQGLEDLLGQASPLLRLMVDLRRTSDLDELLGRSEVKTIESASRIKQRLVLRRLLELLPTSQPAHPERLWRILAMPGMARVLGPEHIARLESGSPMPIELLETISRKAMRFTALSARFELLKRRFNAGGWVKSSELISMLDEIDDQSWHSGLWKSGTGFWREIVGEPWNLDDRDADAPEPLEMEEANISEIQSTDVSARDALASGDFEQAVAFFEEVRSLCMLTAGAHSTTELAARLNLGWLLWKLGHPEEVWRPYLSSALERVRPPVDLVRLRNRISELIEDVEADPGSEKRISRDLANRLEAIALDLQSQGSHELRAEIERTIEVIDELAAHSGLWRSGLDYWTKTTGECWAASDAIPAPPPSGGKRIPDELEEIKDLDKNARKALAAGRRRRAVKAFDRVRLASLQHDPPLTTTEQAARLNLGWTLWELGRSSSIWEPYLSSVLHEVGPPPGLARLRCQAAEMMRDLRGNT